MAYRSTLRWLSWLLAAGIATVLPAQVPLGDTAGEQGYYWSAGRRVSLRSLDDWRAVAGPGVAEGSRSLAAPGDVVEVTSDLILVRRDADDGLSRGLATPSREAFAAGTTDAVLVDSGRLVVELDPTWSRGRVEAAVAGRGLRIVEHLFEGWYVLEPAAGTSGMRLVEVANRLFEDGFARSAQPDFLYPRTHRGLSCPGCVEDTYYRRQWHLEHDGVPGVSPAADVDAEDAWAITRGERGVALAVVDDGFEIRHEDLRGPGKIRAARDFWDGDDDPSPGPNAVHGTACAGVATAVGGNGRGVSGIAPEVTLIPIRYSRFPLGSNVAKVIVYAVEAGADVVSSSWGPKDGDPDVPNDTPRQELPDVVRAAFRYATEKGRDGKGTLIFWAAGNGNEPVSDDGYAASEYVFAVGAINDQARRSFYSDYGPELDFVAPSGGRPSNGARTSGIWTTDLSGNAGYSPGDYTGSFTGTSSATPLAAGVAALVLSVNPDLTWRQVYDVLKETADKVDPAGGRYVDGFSERYGWGKINAGKAVRRARELALASVPQDAGLHVVVRVTDSAGRPLANASFGILKPGRSLERELRGDDVLLLGTTDAEGLFDSGEKDVRVPAGRYQVKVVRSAYRSFAGYVEVGQGSRAGVAVLSFELVEE